MEFLEETVVDANGTDIVCAIYITKVSNVVYVFGSN